MLVTATLNRAYAQQCADAAVAEAHKQWSDAITPEMPADFKDWHDTPASARAEIAAWSIRNLRDRLREAEDIAERLTADVEARPLTSLPALKQALDGGIYCGVLTMPAGKHYAVVWLDAARPAKRLNFTDSKKWAASVGGQLATRTIASLMVTNVGDLLPQEWVWTCEEYGSAYAWYCSLYDGFVGCDDRSAVGRAVAVRLIPLVL